MMKYEIKGGHLPVVVLELQRGESVFTESGGMGWMTDDFHMDTNMEGGLFGGIARKLAGESLFMTTYTCTSPSGIIAFPSSFPGKIIPVTLERGQSMICQKKSFLCGERSVNLEIFFRKKLGAGLFGGEGFILQKVTGPGLAFMEMDGEVIEYHLKNGEVLKVDTGHVAMFEPTVEFDIEMLKGFKNILFGGEGLFLAKLRGPGRVWLQTMPIQNLAKNIIPYMPPSGKE
ncbi:hypothetical protein AN619_16190 [Thermotalea metallivorans]|uniref:TIGR00266 family protein n=2 Tax=Thermotalea metallivorans TaxID=520762 RepID=A0A140L4Z8_9FIRM|nr:hypothetical protein AN619_16190 [Thermotalea metallivorans]